MISTLAQTATAQPETFADTLIPLLTLLSMLWGALATIRASNKAALLRAAIVGVKAGLDSLQNKADAEIVKQQIEQAAGGREAPLNVALKAEVRKTTASLKAYSDDPPAPPRLGTAAALLLAICLSATGCIASAARDLAVAHEAHLRAFDGASQPHASYLVDDAEPGADGVKLTAAEKIARWKAARRECLESARALAEALK